MTRIHVYCLLLRKTSNNFDVLSLRFHPASSGSARGALTSVRKALRSVRATERAKGIKMADLEDVTLDGRPLHSLRVADLKAALEERGLPKSGQKNALIKRLKGVSESCCFLGSAESEDRDSEAERRWSLASC